MTDIPRALLYLFPSAVPLRDYEVADDSDGLGPHIARWLLAAPQPTAEQLAAADTAASAAAQQAAADETTRRGAVAQAVQALVGVRWTDMTAAQKQTLIVALLYKAGAIDKTLTVRPLADWL